MTEVINTSTSKECPACGGYKLPEADFCETCCDYRDRMAQKRASEKLEEQKRKRAAYWAIHG